ncbi:MAG: hypothetical protein ACREJC_14430 [Tepidisphaeraceae bacterium]
MNIAIASLTLEHIAMNRWLARLSFSFFIIAVVLVWTARNPLTGTGPRLEPWRSAVYLVAAGLSFVLGVAGIRARHRSD